ncbi:MAG: hypothetical protein K0Q71_4361 [Thermomicrobiales bacterium]|nr:hypothetical protein [Thermomicrobiales bacterium]
MAESPADPLGLERRRQPGRGGHSGFRAVLRPGYSCGTAPALHRTSPVSASPLQTRPSAAHSVVGADATTGLCWRQVEPDGRLCYTCR